MRTAMVLAVIVSTVGQTDSARFVGTWTAAHAGQTHVRLELTVTGGTLGGRIALADIHVDDQGILSSVGRELSAMTPIFDLAVQGQTLAFSRRDGHDTDHFEMTVISDDVAELRLILSEEDRQELAAEGIAVPKPFRVTKVAP